MHDTDRSENRVRTDGGAPTPSGETMKILSSRYGMQVLDVVGSERPARFKTVQSAIPDASPSTISARLDELEAVGLLERETYDEVPPRVEYELTADGEQLYQHVRSLLAWVTEYE